MPAASLSREAQDAAAAVAWAAESCKPESQRQYFGFDEIAHALARQPGRLEVDSAERKRILRDLADWVRRGKFSASDVVILSGDPAEFLPITPSLPHEIHVTLNNTLSYRRGEPMSGPFRSSYLATPLDTIFLSSRGARRYIDSSALDGAERLIREWFPEASPPVSGEVSPTETDYSHLPTPHDSGQPRARTGTARPRASDAEVKKWYGETYIPECEKAGKQPSELDDWAAAKVKFGEKARRNQIRAVRQRLAPAAWRKQGRRPGSKNSAD